MVGLSPDARYDPRVLDARKRKIEADWNLALMAPQEPVSKEKARWLKAKANLRRVAADARDDEEARVLRNHSCVITNYPGTPYS